MKLIQNAIQTPDGTILVSKSREDSINHYDKNGYTYGVGGGLDFFWFASGAEGKCIKLDLYDSNSISEIADKIVYEKYYPSNRLFQKGENKEYEFIKDIPTDRLKKIASNHPNIWVLLSIFYILNQRGEL